jgi:hypothetical protein
VIPDRSNDTRAPTSTRRDLELRIGATIDDQGVVDDLCVENEQDDLTTGADPWILGDFLEALGELVEDYERRKRRCTR